MRRARPSAGAGQAPRSLDRAQTPGALGNSPPDDRQSSTSEFRNTESPGLSGRPRGLDKQNVKPGSARLWAVGLSLAIGACTLPEPESPSPEFRLPDRLSVRANGRVSSVPM